METGSMDYICERGESIGILLAGNKLLIEFKVAGRSKNAALIARPVAFLCVL